tara:strand:+ start:807 stop:944 length:138 start_codon:yes stop_codon:yes gene_type:complete
MMKRLWLDHRNACFLTLALLVISIVVSPWVFTCSSTADWVGGIDA